jgi:RHS repeat-associated protein
MQTTLSSAFYRPISYSARYTFSGKERDEESGFSYFGARYYNSTYSIWLSVDPMSDKYPSLSPYAYCADNPVKLVDPSGEEIWEPDGKGGWIAQKGDNAWTLHKDAGISYEKAIELMKAQGFEFTDNDQKVKVQVGDRVQVTNTSSDRYDIPYRPPASGRIEFSPFNVEDIILISIPVKYGVKKIGNLIFRYRAARSWKLGSFKTAQKWSNQFAKRGWTEGQITTTIKTGKSFPQTNKVHPLNGATRFENLQNGKSVVIDNKTYELLQVGGNGFKW